MKIISMQVFQGTNTLHPKMYILTDTGEIWGKDILSVNSKKPSSWERHTVPPGCETKSP